MFDICFLENNKLPPLSWCVVLRLDFTGTLHHGRLVETIDNGFFEGGWDGPVNAMGCDQAHFFLGSGGKLSKDGVLFSTPGHVLERIYSTRQAGQLYFSNSLPFVLACSGQKLSDSHYKYESDFASILHGLDSFVGEIPTDRGEVSLHYLTNVFVNKDLNISKVAKPRPPQFTNFADYDNKLSAFLRSLKENLQSDDRKHKYELCTTISNGYDAAACSAKAIEVGCEISCSFSAPEKYQEDDGREISKVLGIKKVEYGDASAYLNREDLIEAEFISSGELGTGIVFSSFEKLWTGKAVFMGERGDKFWDKNWEDVNDVMRVSDEVFAGTSMIENRLRVGYVLIPLPMFAALSWPSISKISNSQELKPFSVGGGYDRPIPRKILEDRGVPRDVFGINKIGAGFNYRYDNSARLKNRMSLASVKDFNDFISRYGRSKFGCKKFLIFISFFWGNKFLYASKLMKKFKLARFLPNDKPTLVANPGIPNDLIRWGVHTTYKKYLQCLENNN